MEPGGQPADEQLPAPQTDDTPAPISAALKNLEQPPVIEAAPGKKQTKSTIVLTSAQSDADIATPAILNDAKHVDGAPSAPATSPTTRRLPPTISP
jgi:hypothetical protein